MPLRWGVLGTARIVRAVVPPLQVSERNELVAIASRNGDRAEKAAREWKIPQAYKGYETLLAEPEIDVVYIPLPNALHAEWTIAAVRAGKHVLCEKPLGLSLTEIDGIAAAAEKAGVVVAEAFMYRHHACTLKVKELVDGGAVGRLRLIRGAFTFNLTDSNDVRWDPSLGGGSLWDLGCYPVGYARLVVGDEPVEVAGWQVTGSSGVDETFVGQLRFVDGALAQIDCGFRSQFRTFMEIVGSEGVLRVPRPFKPGAREVLELVRGDEEELVGVAGDELYLGEIEDLADGALLGKPSRVSLADSRGNCATLLALLESARAGRPVRLDEVD